tara:strand:+ start:6160 stop:6459 length:300 start_codon:yes stop_codon:yes gene_type:complete
MRTCFAGLVVVALLTTAAEAQSSLSCSPIGPASRVLQSANPNDLHPDWTGESYIGTGWSVIAQNSASRDGVDYLEGQLFSPRGSFQSQVYIIANEWTCS